MRLKRFFSPSWLLQQKTIITIENDIVAGDALLLLRGNSYDSFGWIGKGRLLFCLFFFVNLARKVPPSGPEIKWNA